MRLEEALARIGWPEHAPLFQEGWEASQASLPAGPIPFLQPDTLIRFCEQTYLPPDIATSILQTAERIQANAGLRAVAWYCHERLFQVQDLLANPREWPVPLEVLGDLAGLFYAVVLLSGTAYRQAVHRRLGVPEQIVKDSVYHLELCIRTERPHQFAGRGGVTGHLLAWLLLTWSGQLYRLGRLEFIPNGFFGKIRAYRNIGTGAVVALSEEDQCFRADGQFDGAGQVTDPDGAWISTLIETQRQILGYPVAPSGRVLARRIRLRRSEWRQILAPGDPILAIHIPAGPPPMDFEACGDSLRQALAFFPRVFPEKPFVGFACGSWLLDPQIQDLMPPTSNLVRFQREQYLFPWPGGSGEMPWQVQVRRDPATGRAPAMSRMQHAFYAHADRGGRFRAAGSFLMTDDLNWGQQVYLTQERPWKWLR